jgi:hypothetical protein
MALARYVLLQGAHDDCSCLTIARLSRCRLCAPCETFDIQHFYLLVTRLELSAPLLVTVPCDANAHLAAVSRCASSACHWIRGYINQALCLQQGNPDGSMFAGAPSPAMYEGILVLESEHGA